MTKTKSRTKPASWWAERDKTPKNINKLHEAVNEERLARFKDWDNSHYLVWLCLFEHSTMGFVSFIKQWSLSAPGQTVEGSLASQTGDTYRIAQSGGHRESVSCPVFQTEEMAQDFACSLDLGRQQRIRLTTDEEKFHNPLVLPDVGLIDKWLDNCFQELCGGF